MSEPVDPVRGLDFQPLPAGWTPLGAALLIKCLDDEGSVTWAFRTSDELNDEELLGALRVRTSLHERDLLEAYCEHPDEG